MSIVKEEITSRSVADRSPMSVAFVSPGWPPDAVANGIVPYIADVCAEMRKAGHRAAVLSQKVVGDVDDPEVFDLGRSASDRGFAARAVDSMIARVSPYLAFQRSGARKLVEACRELIRSRGLQLVEIEESYGFSRLLQEAVPIPVVVRLHGPWFLNGPLRGAVDDHAYRSRVGAEGHAIREARAITAPSLDVLRRTREYYGLPIEHARVIPPSTKVVPPEARWIESGCEPDTIVFVGRFDRHKGGDLVIDAFAEVARQHPSARLRFVGPDTGMVDDAGRPWTIQEYLAEKLPAELASGRVEWLGSRPNGAIPEIRRKGAVVVVGSRYDNFPLTVLEGMALGCPLVAPRIGGIPEIVEDGANGLLYEVGNPGDMAAKLLLMLADREMAARLGHQAGIDCERNHSAETIARQISAYFREILDPIAPGKERSR